MDCPKCGAPMSYNELDTQFECQYCECTVFDHSALQKVKKNNDIEERLANQEILDRQVKRQIAEEGLRAKKYENAFTKGCLISIVVLVLIILMKCS